MPVLVLLAILSVIGTVMSSPANSEQWPQEKKMPWSKEEISKIFSKLGWSQEDIVIALSNSNNVTMSDNASSMQSHCVELGAFGGGGGGPFNDPCNQGTMITRIEVTSGPLTGCANCIRSLRVTYSDGNTILHGLPSGNPSVANFDHDQLLVGMALRHGSLIDQIAFVTVHMGHGHLDVFGPYGGTGGGPSITFGKMIQAFYGRKGHGIDQIGGKGEPLL